MRLYSPESHKSNRQDKKLMLINDYWLFKGKQVKTRFKIWLVSCLILDFSLFWFLMLLKIFIFVFSFLLFFFLCDWLVIQFYHYITLSLFRTELGVGVNSHTGGAKVVGSCPRKKIFAHHVTTRLTWELFFCKTESPFLSFSFTDSLH